MASHSAMGSTSAMASHSAMGSTSAMASHSQDPNTIVDALVQKIEREFKGFNISEVVKGGSLGHGTAVPAKYDIDLVIYSRDITGQAVLQEGSGLLFTKWLLQLRAFLQKAFGREFNETDTTTRSVQFQFRGIDVDLLVSPFWGENPAEFYKFLRGVPRHQQSSYTVGASKWQVQFFKKQPPQVKELIRKAKAWRNEQWPESTGGSGKPSSYLMSLLVVAAYEKNPRDVTSALKELVGGNPDICWTDFYEKSDVKTLLPSRPRIVDPANPANNVWTSGIYDYRRGERISNYEPGDGNSAVLKSKISSINLN